MCHGKAGGIGECRAVIDDCDIESTGGCELAERQGNMAAAQNNHSFRRCYGLDQAEAILRFRELWLQIFRIQRDQFPVKTVRDVSLASATGGFDRNSLSVRQISFHIAV